MKKIKWPNWPNYGNDEHEAVSRVIKSNQLFAEKEVRSFEHEFAEYIEVKNALGVGNATQGLHLALAALNIGAGDEVITTTFSWISSASCILMQNAVPVFTDIEERTLGICPKSLEENITSRTKAIILVHLFGYPSQIEEIIEIANRYDLPIIEDASHAHGASYKNNKVGSFGKISVFSLHQRKTLSVGDGGVVCTDDDEIANKIFQLRSFGNEELSYNYRMTEFAGALGKVGLSKLDEHNKIRIKNAENLASHLDLVDGIHVRLNLPNTKSVYYSLVLELSSELGSKIDFIVEKANAFGLPLKKTWEPLNFHPHFNPINSPARGVPWRWEIYGGSYCENKDYKDLVFPVAFDYCYNRIIELPIHPPVNNDDIFLAATIIKNIINESK
jgi:perosamine synthetase